MESFYFKYPIKMFLYELILEVDYINTVEIEFFLYKRVEQYIYSF